MKRKWLFTLLLIPAANCAWAQQPVKTTHLSVPKSSPTQQQPAQQQPGSTNPERKPNTFGDVQQQVMTDLFSQTVNDANQINLPPLEVLLEYARNSPIIEYHRLREEASVREQTTVKRTWLKYFKLNANYQYGNQYLSSSTENQPQVFDYLYYTQQQHWWYVGASVSFPLDEIFDRRNRIKKFDAVIDQSQYEAEAWFNEQKVKIIEAYTDAEMCLAMIRIKSENSTIATQVFRASEADFINGRIDVGELSRQKGIQNVAVTEYEQVRARLYQAILKLEHLCNYKILNNSTTKEYSTPKPTSNKK